MSRHIRPNFFIVGAPKCGTTALASYLSTHPDIYLAPKEPHFFGRDLSFRRALPYRDPKAYFSLFEGRHERMTGDASVWYLYSRSACQEIYELNSRAKIIACIRNPIDFLYSEYYQLRYNGDEDAESFEEALGAESRRKDGLGIPDSTAPGPIEALLYMETVCFSEQLARYMARFGRDRVNVIVYDDFRDRTRDVFDSALRFLGVSLECVPDLAPVNANKAIRNERLWRFMKFAPQPMRAVWRASLPAPIRGRILKWVNSYNAVEKRRPPMKPETRAYLQSALRPEVERLSALLDRDLMPWVDTADGRLPEITEQHR